MGISHSEIGSYGGAEEKKASCMLFTSEQVNVVSGYPSYLTETYLYRDRDISEQDDCENSRPEKVNLFFHKKGNTLNQNLMVWHSKHCQR